MIRPLKARLDRIEGKATGTLTDAEEFILLAAEMLKEVQDGVNITFERTDEGTLFDFAMGRNKTFPFKMVINIEEGDE